MSQPRRYLAVSLLSALIAVSLWYWMRPAPTVTPPAVNHSYTKALEQAHNGMPGAARVLYQQLARTDLSDIRRASLHAELPNYPSPQALKLADADLQNASPLVRKAAIQSIVGLVPNAQRTLLLGPLLEDPEQSVRFAAASALLGLSPDEQGLYFVPLQQVVDEYERNLKTQPDDPQAQGQLARLYLHEGQLDEAQAALEKVTTLDPENLKAVVAKIDLLDKRGKTDQARELLARQLQAHPDSAYLQHALGIWLLNHGQTEYALLGLAKAVELEPDNSEYRYKLAIALHDLEQLEPAQRQLEELLQRQPANRKARLLLIRYWKEAGQLQNVQVLLAQLEQQNPDDPALQQGL
ncbi:tetratricopeptide repeat protein [Pseudomonas sp. NPDC096917]|uniref:tetratricopeptide repeat protein n=1 Tax=Pseudomonas sp. NPDC096917 TaxID=3364483 RepID=UPI00383A4EC6